MYMLENFKVNKKVMQIKLDQANKMADAAVDEFIDSIKILVKDASEEDLKAILNSDDEMLEDVDKMAFIAAFAESHNANFAVIGFTK